MLIYQSVILFMVSVIDSGAIVHDWSLVSTY